MSEQKQDRRGFLRNISIAAAGIIGAAATSIVIAPANAMLKEEHSTIGKVKINGKIVEVYIVRPDGEFVPLWEEEDLKNAA